MTDSIFADNTDDYGKTARVILRTTSIRSPRLRPSLAEAPAAANKLATTISLYGVKKETKETMLEVIVPQTKQARLNALARLSICARVRGWAGEATRATHREGEFQKPRHVYRVLQCDTFSVWNA